MKRTYPQHAKPAVCRDQVCEIRDICSELDEPEKEQLLSFAKRLKATETLKASAFEV